jgi:hypothetical protein
MGIARMLTAQKATQQSKQIANTEILLLGSFMCLMPNDSVNPSAWVNAIEDSIWSPTGSTHC